MLCYGGAVHLVLATSLGTSRSQGLDCHIEPVTWYSSRRLFDVFCFGIHHLTVNSDDVA